MRDVCNDAWKRGRTNAQTTVQMRTGGVLLGHPIVINRFHSFVFLGNDKTHEQNDFGVDCR